MQDRTIDWRAFNVVDGTPQDERLPLALNPGYILAQERSLAERIVIIANASEGVQFFDNANNPAGSWAKLFTTKHALKMVQMAKMASIRPKEKRQTFKALLDSDIAASMQELYSFACQINESLPYIARENQNSPMAVIYDYPKLTRILKSFDTHGHDNIGEIIRDLMPSEDINSGAIAQARSAIQTVLSNYNALVIIAQNLRSVSSQIFEACLSSGKLDPALGLLVTQIKLIMEVEAQTNAFTDRHIKYYYEALLKQVPKTGSPASALMYFQVTKKPALLESGTRLSATSEDAQNSLNFELRETMRAAPIKIERVCNLKFVRDANILPQAELGFSTGMRVHEFDLTANSEPRPLFNPILAPQSALGFSVQSPLLFLSEGSRVIDVRLILRRRVNAELPDNSKMPNVSLKPEKRVAKDSQNSELGNRSFPTLIAQILQSDPELVNAYKLSKTGNAGNFLKAVKRSWKSRLAQKWLDHSLTELSQNIEKTAETDIAVLADAIGKLEASLKWGAIEKHNGSTVIQSIQDLVYLIFFHAAETSEQLATISGRVITSVIIENRPWPLPGNYIKDFVRKSLTLFPKDAGKKRSHKMWNSPHFTGTKSELFQYMLGRAFTAELTTESGQLTLDRFHISSLDNDDLGHGNMDNSNEAGICFKLELDQSAPAIIAPENGPAPILTLKISNESWFFPFSLFELFSLDRIDLQTHVKGLTKLTAFSDDGPLDMAQPILPFGARPKDQHQFMIGSDELGRKPVSHISLSLDWMDIPRDPGGFEAYYAGYGDGFEPPEPRIKLEYLSHNKMQSLTEKAVPLIDSSQPGDRLQKRRKISAKLPGKISYPEFDPDSFRQKNSIRSGLLSLSLNCPDDCFGHERYPLILAKSLKPKRFSWKQPPTLQAPFTPKIMQASIDYSAKSSISFDVPEEAHPDEVIRQIGIFESREIFPSQNYPHAGLFQERLGDGTLFLQIVGTDIIGAISILFNMEISNQGQFVFKAEPLIWHYLAEDGWKPLPNESFVSDSTEGLMRSGIISLHVPTDATLNASEMPGNGLWLAISANQHLDAFPRLVSVHMNGAVVTSIDNYPDAMRDDPPKNWALETPNPKIAKVIKSGDKIGAFFAENDRRFRARISETLLHRGRAVTAWDIERIVLDNFPDVWKAKCFPVMDRRQRDVSPGAITVVVVPYAPDSSDFTQAHMHDVLTLRRIEEKLRQYTSPFAKIEVRNPAYERIQIRGKVGFMPAQDKGVLLNLLKSDISEYLSVWSAPKPRNGFGWSVNLNEMGAYILDRDYVKFLTDFSMLHLVSDDNQFHTLSDTAVVPGHESTYHRFTAAQPWGLLLPMEDHWISVASSAHIETPQRTGIGELRMGRNFVITTGSQI